VEAGEDCSFMFVCGVGGVDAGFGLETLLTTGEG